MSTEFLNYFKSLYKKNIKKRKKKNDPYNLES